MIPVRSSRLQRRFQPSRDLPDDPAAAMRPWIDEVLAVRGEASLLWHTQTMHPDYGWGPGYLALLDMLRESGADVTGPIA